MKICLAQTRPYKGDISRNIDSHKKFIDAAASIGADMIVFPELSITGYEPQLAKELATTPGDSRLNELQNISDAKQITIAAGIPTRQSSGVLISMLIFRPQQPRQIYSKQYLHADEEPYFIPGQHDVFLKFGFHKIAPAICYELSVPAHSEKAFQNQADVYIASVAKTAAGVAKAIEILSGIATKYSMTVMMSNCIGVCDGDECGGRTSIWNTTGELLGQLSGSEEGILMLDTARGLITARRPADTESLTANIKK
jgi:predicted amidohydrolase